jgi:hypothetical protein
MRALAIPAFGVRERLGARDDRKVAFTVVNNILRAIRVVFPLLVAPTLPAGLTILLVNDTPQHIPTADLTMEYSSNLRDGHLLCDTLMRARRPSMHAKKGID